MYTVYHFLNNKTKYGQEQYQTIFNNAAKTCEKKYLPLITRIVIPSVHIRGRLHVAEEELLESVFGHAGFHDAVDHPRKGVHGVDQHLQQRNGCARKTKTANENIFTR